LTFAVGMSGVFPLWMRDAAVLAREMLESGVRARLTCVDTRKLDASFVGRQFDTELLAMLPAGIDPCGENGEFHTFTSAGPMFPWAIPVVPGEVVVREGFAFADLLPEP
jgi:diphthamide synthase (EF-2-diphthine--ammonia ligase)